MHRKWSRNSAILGALTWTALGASAGAGRAPLGVIELLFLFAPLVMVPLGMALGDMVLAASHSRIEQWVVKIQFFAAVAVVASFWLSPAPPAAILALPWAILCLGLAWVGARSLASSRSLAAWAINLGRLDLAVAGGWLMASRLGMRPLGFQEPVVLLTAVHFQYTGFATATILAAAVTAAQKHQRLLGPLKPLAWVALTLPFVLAIGFVYSPLLKMIAAQMLVVALAGIACVQFLLARSLSARASRAYLYLSSLAVVAGMAVAAVYALGDWVGRDWLRIPRVAGTHGVLNALGFALCGLLGWLVEFAPGSGQAASHAYPMNYRAASTATPHVHVLQ